MLLQEMKLRELKLQEMKLRELKLQEVRLREKCRVQEETVMVVEMEWEEEIQAVTEEVKIEYIVVLDVNENHHNCCGDFFWYHHKINCLKK